MRTKRVIGNWKMNTTLDEGVELVKEIKSTMGNKTCIVCVPYTHLSTLSAYVDKNLYLGAQNVATEKSGAYTGEISNQMLQSIGQVSYVIIGHSERRTYYNETNETVNSKVKRALEVGIKPIICCGELLELRKQGNHLNYIKNQILEAIKGLSEDEVAQCILAYEPIWAIGTGESATPAQAQEVHKYIRQTIAQTFTNSIAKELTIVYGGSVKPSNAKVLFMQKDIDGALVGGASLKATDFIQIINAL